MSGLANPLVPSKPKWGSPQDVYNRACMVILFHKALYYELSIPAIEDFQYDLMERYLYHLAIQPGVVRHQHDPLLCAGCPHVLPRTVKTWAGEYQRHGSLPHGHVMEFDDAWKAYLQSINIKTV